MVQPYHSNFWEKDHLKDTDKKSNLETESLAKLADCAQTVIFFIYFFSYSTL